MTRAVRAARHLGTSMTLLCVAAGLTLRLEPAGTAFLFGDEFHTLSRLSDDYWTIFSRYSGTGAGIALPLLQHVAMELFGQSLWSIRAPAYLPGVLAVLVCYPVARTMVGPAAAAGATMLLAGSSYHIFYSHFARAYALAILLVLLLMGVVARAQRSKSRGSWTWLVLAVLCALLPFVHLATLGAVAPILVVFIVTLIGRGDRGRTRSALLAIGVGAALCMLLHLPATDPLLRFVEKKAVQQSYYGSFGALDVLALLGGSWIGGWLWALGSLAGSAAVFRERHASAWLLVSACLGPALALVVLRPYGDAYAYSRYVAPAIPAWCILTAHLCGVPWRSWLGRSQASEGLQLATAFVLTAGLFLAGPLGLSRVDDGPYANTYLGLFTLEEFSATPEPTSEFYRQLAALDRGATILELPRLANRSVHLYRAYYLLHRQRSLSPAIGAGPARLHAGPYAEIGRAELSRSGVDFVVAHRDPLAEVDRYWEQVYAAPDRSFEQAYMERHERFGREAVRAPSIDVLRLELGAPSFEDEWLVVWELRADSAR